MSLLDEIPVAHYFCGGTYAKETRIPAGHVLVQHKHHFDHLSILASGNAVVSAGDQSQAYEGPTVLKIKAGMHHGVKALTDCVWYCMHATDVADDDTLVTDADEAEMRRLASV